MKIFLLVNTINTKTKFTKRLPHLKDILKSCPRCDHAVDNSTSDIAKKRC